MPSPQLLSKPEKEGFDKNIWAMLPTIIYHRQKEPGLLGFESRRKTRRIILIVLIVHILSLEKEHKQ
jgi:hypothetical protein